MISRLKRQTKRRHSVRRRYEWTLTLVPFEPIIGAPLTPDVFAGGFVVSAGTPPSRSALRRWRR